ncbi:MAG: hypothetical protein ACRD2H_08730 [Terriglobales bacterium]
MASEYLLAAPHAEGAGQARSADLIDSVGAGEPGLAPGASRTLSLPPNVLSARVDAVIYEDGTSAGDPVEIQYLLALRQQEFEDIPKIQAALAELTTEDPASVTPVAATWRGPNRGGPPSPAVEAGPQPRPTGAASRKSAALALIADFREQARLRAASMPNLGKRYPKLDRCYSWEAYLLGWALTHKKSIPQFAKSESDVSGQIWGRLRHSQPPLSPG